MSKIRQQRTADQIQRLLSDLIRREMNDPRLQGISITEVSVDRELEHADIYVNAMGDETRKEEVMQAFSKAGGFLRHELANRMQIKAVPKLHFHWDPSLARAEQVSEILDNLQIPPPESDESDSASEK